MFSCLAVLVCQRDTNTKGGASYNNIMLSSVAGVAENNDPVSLFIVYNLTLCMFMNNIHVQCMNLGHTNLPTTPNPILIIIIMMILHQ